MKIDSVPDVDLDIIYTYMAHVTVHPLHTHSLSLCPLSQLFMIQTRNSLSCRLSWLSQKQHGSCGQQFRVQVTSQRHSSMPQMTFLNFVSSLLFVWCLNLLKGRGSEQFRTGVLNRMGSEWNSGAQNCTVLLQQYRFVLVGVTRG